MSFDKIYYKGKEVMPDATRYMGYIYVKPTRNHWWQFWRPKQKFMDWEDILRG